MRAQLRRYQVKPGAMEAFVELWEHGIVAVRELYGFTVVAAWRSDDDAEFGWVVGHVGSGSFEAAEKAYYASPERAALDDVLQYLDHVETRMVETL
jgi:heme-degrading monooxygenase HmoA